MSKCKYCKKNVANTLFCSSLCVTDFAEKFDKLEVENKKYKKALELIIEEGPYGHGFDIATRALK